MNRRASALIALIMLCLAAPTIACLWDYDTMKMSIARAAKRRAVLVGDGRSTLNFFTKTASAECASGLPRNLPTGRARQPRRRT